MSQDGAGVLVPGKARARRIPTEGCNERATPPGAKRTSQMRQLFLDEPLVFRFREQNIEADGRARGGIGELDHPAGAVYPLRGINIQPF
ncbi:hypothetical protein RZS08_05325, partial [Arthrospira platensis SPKY1]|nr:hypothetical protein [Arthrospira platensis SPKY1]